MGLGNLISGLCGGRGGCGLLGQSLVNISAGGTGRASAVAYVLFVALGLTCFGSLMGAIPVGALVGLMLAVARHTFSWSSVRLLYSLRRPSPADGDHKRGWWVAATPRPKPGSSVGVHGTNVAPAGTGGAWGWPTR